MPVRRALHVLTAIAVVVAIVVAVVTGHEERSGAVRVRTSVPLQWAPAALPATVPPTATPDSTTTTAPPATTTPATTGAPAPANVPLTAPVDVPIDVSPQLVVTFTQPVVEVFDEPGDPQPEFALPSSTWFGNPTTLPVVQRGAGWLKVLLPVRPNGSEGWIREPDAALSYVTDRVRVDLTDRRLVWWHDGQVVSDVPVAVGTPASPTPTGTFFVTDLIPQPPTSAYGAWIVALDGHSETFATFDGGDARIAIHGTNEPASIGQATSSGCVRVGDDVLGQLAANLQLGTPVEIR